MKIKCFQKGYPGLFIAVEYQLYSLNALFIYKNQMFLPRVSKVTYCALCESFKEMFTAVRKTKLSAQNKDHNKWILWCVFWGWKIQKSFFRINRLEYRWTVPVILAKKRPVNE